MSYVPKPDTGTIWPNDRKKSDNHPDMRGDIFISRDLLRTLATKNQDPLIKISVAAWKKVLGGKNCLSVSLSEPYEKPVERSSRDDSDIPF